MHPSVEEVGTDTPVEDDVVVEEDSNISVTELEGAIAEDEGAGHTGEEGASHTGEEGANTDAGNGHNEAEHNVDRTRGGYNLRPNRAREYSHRFDPRVYSVTNMHAARTPEVTTPMAQRLFGFVFTQMSARAGIKKHGQSARDALTAEFAQLEYKGVYEPIRATDLTETQ